MKATARLIILSLLTVLCALGCNNVFVVHDGQVDLFLLSDGSLMRIRDNPAASNVNYAALVSFLDSLEGSRGACGSLAVDLHDRAEANEIRAGVVMLELVSGYHAANVFETTDQGKVYVDMVSNSKCICLEMLKQRHSCVGPVYEFW